MATNITAQSVLADISQGHLECPICSDRFKQPKLLQCSHSFCLECLQKVRQNSPNYGKLSCPVCRQDTVINENGINGLKADFKSISLLEGIEQQEIQLKQLRGQEHHSKCRKHTDKDLIMYCNTCSKLICTICIVKDHQPHSLTEINEALDKCKQHATELIAKKTQSITTFNFAIQEIDKSLKTLDCMFAATKKKISERADEEIAKEVERISEEEENLMQEAELIYQDRVNTMEIARATNTKEMTVDMHKVDVVTELMDQGSQYKIVHHIKQLLTDLKEYREMKPTKVSDRLNYMDFKEGQKSLGGLVLQYTMSLKTEMKKYMNTELEMVEFSPWDVAAYSNGDIVVSDLKVNSLVTISAKSNLQSTVIPQALSVKGLTKSSCVTVNKNDELVVLDDGVVKIFSRNYQLLHQFIPGTSGSSPSCVAVYDNTLVAVGYSNKDEITLHRLDGCLVKTLRAPGIGGYLSTCRGRIIYINCGANKLVSVYFTGDIVFSVDINQPGRPQSVCCDKDGGIYLAVRKRQLSSSSSSSSSGEIHCYSPDGKYIGCIINDCSNPWGITLTPAGDLVVASDKSVQIYHRK